MLTYPRNFEYNHKHVVEVRNEYTNFLTGILTPLLFEGFNSLYQDAMNIELQLVEKSKLHPGVEQLGVLKIFQSIVKEIPNMSSSLLDSEVSRIKDGCGCSEWFENLIKATIKSNIIMMLQNESAVDPNYHETIIINEFIHKCYIECAKSIYNCPELFYDKYPSIEIKKNQREVFIIIKTAIEEAIRRSLPMNIILQDYLSYPPTPEDHSKIKELLVEEQTKEDSDVDKRLEEMKNELETEKPPSTKYNTLDSLNKDVYVTKKTEVESVKDVYIPKKLEVESVKDVYIPKKLEVESIKEVEDESVEGFELKLDPEEKKKAYFKQYWSSK